MPRMLVLLSVICFLTTSLQAEGLELVLLNGTPQQIGERWGATNREAIVQDLQKAYLNPAQQAGISREQLLERTAESLQIIQEIAPHWLEEWRAIARSAGVDEDLYLAYVDGQVRNRFLHECTSYAVPRQLTAQGAIFFHKNRDNLDRAQSAAIVDSSLPGIHKFITITDASRLTCSMMVNEQGLAGAADYPADRKKDSSNLTLPPSKPRYRGLMSDAILRHIAERAGTSEEALAILQQMVSKGYFAGGEVNGNHWLFVDRHGTIIEVCNNSEHVVSQVHRQKAYFSRLNKSAAANRLRNHEKPIDFHTFHNISRDPSICFNSSISGMTVEIDPDHPELLTCAWIALPARSVAFPIWMGQQRIPATLMNGTSYLAAKKNSQPAAHWEELERSLYEEKEQLKSSVVASIEAGNPIDAHIDQLEFWSTTQAARLAGELKVSPSSAAKAAPPSTR